MFVLANILENCSTFVMWITINSFMCFVFKTNILCQVFIQIDWRVNRNQFCIPCLMVGYMSVYVRIYCFPFLGSPLPPIEGRGHRMKRSIRGRISVSIDKRIVCLYLLFTSLYAFVMTFICLFRSLFFRQKKIGSTV